MSAQSDFHTFIHKYGKAVASLLDETLFDGSVSGKASINYQLPIFMDNKQYVVFVNVPLANGDVLTSTEPVTQTQLRYITEDEIATMAATHATYINTTISDNGLVPLPERQAYKNQLSRSKTSKSEYFRVIL